MIEITVTLKVDGEALVRELMQNYPEYSQVMRCVAYDYDACRYEFIDGEDGQRYELDLPKLVEGLRLMLIDLHSDKIQDLARWLLPDFQDAANWDAGCNDALVQYAAFGKRIYG